MVVKIAQAILLIFAVSTLTFAGTQAWAARAAMRSMDCPEQGNWCTPLRGGIGNCIECCGGNPESICLFYEDDPMQQGCLCAG